MLLFFAVIRVQRRRLQLIQSSYSSFFPSRSSTDLLGSSVGVFVGCIWSEYGELLAAHQEHSSSARGGSMGSSQVVTGNGLAFMAGRVSYTFGLTGVFRVLST
jgi:acyl transferase domain-containing protein